MNILTARDVSRPVSFAELFGREAPVEIEIGVGKGRFLRDYGLINPGTNLLGIEKSKKWLRHAAARIDKAGVQNVVLIEGFVEELLREIPAGSVRTYHVYFPDPWPKRRHSKRRLFSEWFVRQVFLTLAPGGEIRVASDHVEYFREIRSSLMPLHGQGWTVSDSEPNAIPTNYQLKYLREGRPLAFAVARRTSTQV